MGCDGGTIPKRDELVKTKKKPEQKDKNAELAHRWKNCAISQAPLQQPIVACELGRLYSKETVLETLLDKSAAVAEQSTSTPAVAANDVASHIRTLRDVKSLNLTENPAWSESEATSAEKGDGYIDMQKAKWICPVSGQEMNGRFRFVFLWTCGCVFSEKAMRELTKTRQDFPYECLKCQKPFELQDAIPMNPVDANEIAYLQEKMEQRRSKAKDKKKSKKVKAEEAGQLVPSSLVTNGETNGMPSKSDSSSTKTAKTKVEVASSSKSDKRKGEKAASADLNGNGSNGVKKRRRSESTSDPGAKLVSYSVAKDPKASSTYKSLFTSSEKGQGQQRAHWVTYNPFYN